MSSGDWSDPAELERTWRAALVRVPVDDGSVLKARMDELPQQDVPTGTAYPTVIYLHGCSGIWPGTYRRIDFLARNGFAVIAPASFARAKYPQSCDPATHKGGMYRDTLKMRQFDAGYAIAKAKTLPWVDTENVFLMGLSEGGITTATFSSRAPAARVNARVVEGWTCHAGWSEYKGINAPDTEPVLTLVGEGDPWFQSVWTKGECGKFLSETNGSRSVVYRQGRLRTQHELLEDDRVKATVIDFLSTHKK
jgi:dienelactone hydrolase